MRIDVLSSSLMVAACLFASARAETLAPGWHLLVNSTSKPLSVATAFGTQGNPVAGVTSGVVSVWTWDSGSASWSFYSPTQADGGAAFAQGKGYAPLTQIAFNRGYWINVGSPIQLSAAAFSSSAEAFLPGWHLLGNLAAQPLNVAQTFGTQTAPLVDVTRGINSVWGWDSGAATWGFYTPTQADNGAGYAAGKGYSALMQIPSARGFWANVGSTIRLSQGAGAAPSGPQSLAACPADIGTPLFDTLPVEVNDFMAFRPLGFMSTPIHMFPAKHAAFSMTPIGQSAVQKPVRAPGKVTVTEIWEASFSTGGKNYQVFLYPCREVRVYFGHVATLSAKLMTEFNKAAPNCNSFNDGTATVTTCRRENLSLPLASGEEFGTGPDSAGVDFGTLDFRRAPAAFINLAHYDTYYPYYTAPLDYFTPAVRQALEAKTGNVFGGRMRSALPIGGSHMQDILGTAQGNWFVPGTYHSNSTDLSPMLGLAHDYVDPAQPILSIGNNIKGMSMGLYSFKAAAEGLINRDFSSVRADGNVYCFDNFIQGQSAGSVPLTTPNGILLMSMPTDLSLKVELAEGTTCAASPKRAFSANARSFER